MQQMGEASGTGVEDMTIALHWYYLAIVLTIATSATAVFADKGQSGGDYAFGQAFIALAHAVLGIIVILTIWLTYFIAVALGLPS